MVKVDYSLPVALSSGAEIEIISTDAYGASVRVKGYPCAVFDDEYWHKDTIWSYDEYGRFGDREDDKNFYCIVNVDLAHTFVPEDWS